MTYKTPNDPTTEPLHDLTVSLASLKEAARLIEVATFELADKVPSAMIAEFIAVAVELERLLRSVTEMQREQGAGKP